MPSQTTQADKEKHGAALSSVVAAVFLTLMKLVVGLSTNSLGILSEAAHSGLDLLAACVTYFAVRFSSRPADRQHPYGHGKIENLSALIETVLLLATCVYIVYEATVRLLFKPEHVDVTWWSFGVMAVSIVVDVSRSRMLKRMADKHRSQALEADALHFSTDVWASAVVILGLGCLAAAKMMDPASLAAKVLERADAVAALGVCVIVVKVSVKLARDAVNVLLDGGTQDLADKVREAVLALPGVVGVSQVRARVSGPSAFVDMAIEVPRKSSLAQAHETSALAEDTVRALVPDADVVVRLTPVEGDETMFETVRALAAKHNTSVHGLHLHRAHSGMHLEMHVEAPDNMTLAQAHDMVSRLEAAICAQQAKPLTIASHIEPVGEGVAMTESQRDQSRAIREDIARLVANTPDVSDLHEVVVHRVGGAYSVSFHCCMEPGLPIAQAHDMTARLENLVRANVKDVGRVVIHVEPGEPAYPVKGP